jgi:tetratricopeptide (TPR) repeat protein
MIGAIASQRAALQGARAGVLLWGAVVIGGCAAKRPAPISPNEIPSLAQRVARNPTNAEIVFRLSAALFAGGQCDSASVVARKGMALRPETALGPMIVGQCLERARDWEQALGVYRTYLTAFPEGPGSPSVRARQVIAQRDRANALARLALEREAEMAELPTDPDIVAVLPVSIVGDPEYQPLSRGLAQILTSDLALLQRFRMVERLQVGALLDEMRLGRTDRVDPSTVARVGRMLQAGRMVQGLAVIEVQEETRLEASVVLSDGEVTTPAIQEGELERLLEMEKRVVIDIANQLGYFLSEAELRLIFENGTQNLIAFLAYSRGLVAEDLGDYNAAALHYREAVQADPGFQAAREQYQATAVATAVQNAAPGAIVTAAAQSPAEPLPTVSAPTAPTAPAAAPVNPIASTVSDIASIQAEQVAATQTPVVTGTQTSAQDPPPTPTIQGTPITLTGRIRIIFRLP